MMRILIAGLLLTACGKAKTESAPSEAPAKNAAPAATPTTSAPPATPASAPDPFASGFCEYSVDAGPPNKGGGGIMNVQSKHWISDERGKRMAAALLVNCGADKKINLAANDKEIPLAPGKFKVVKTGDVAGAFGVLGPDFMGGEGELELTAFDAAHVAGTFKFTSGGKTYAGQFDLKCPEPGNGICK